MGWKVVPSGGYTDGTSDFASIISKFKSANVEILHAVPIPPDFITFWRQAHQNGFTPKIASISKALLFPSAADALGPLVHNVMSPLWWTPQFPYKSSLDGTTASAFAADYKTRPATTGPSRWGSTTPSSRSRWRRSRRPATPPTARPWPARSASSRARPSPGPTTSPAARCRTSRRSPNCWRNGARYPAAPAGGHRQLRPARRAGREPDADAVTLMPRPSPPGLALAGGLRRREELRLAGRAHLGLARGRRGRGRRRRRAERRGQDHAARPADRHRAVRRGPGAAAGQRT